MQGRRVKKVRRSKQFNPRGSTDLVRTVTITRSISFNQRDDNNFVSPQQVLRQFHFVPLFLDNRNAGFLLSTFVLCLSRDNTSTGFPSSFTLSRYLSPLSRPLFSLPSKNKCHRITIVFSLLPLQHPSLLAVFLFSLLVLPLLPLFANSIFKILRRSMTFLEACIRVHACKLLFDLRF